MLRGIQWPQTPAAHSRGLASGASTRSSSSPSHLAQADLKCGPGSPRAALPILSPCQVPADCSWGCQREESLWGCGSGDAQWERSSICEAWPLQNTAGKQERSFPGRVMYLSPPHCLFGILAFGCGFGYLLFIWLCFFCSLPSLACHCITFPPLPSCSSAAQRSRLTLQAPHVLPCTRCHTASPNTRRSMELPAP